MRFTDALIAFLNEQTAIAGLPSVMVDYLADSDSLSLQTITQPTTRQSYIDGSCLRQFSFRLLFKKTRMQETSSVPALQAIQTLEAIVLLFEGMQNFPIDDRFTIIGCECSTPSIIDRNEAGDTTYGATISLDYKENPL